MSKIFIIDDDVNILFSLQAKISLAGHKTYINQGNSLEDTLQQIKSFLPDYLIFEPNLNVFDGVMFLKKAKNDFETAHIPIFIFSKSQDQSDRELVLNLGASQYFNKSDLMIDDFVIKLDKIISNLQRQQTNYENQI